ncbi:uncharacterized protein LOC113372746 [Ctenocephalides felis]|uniref:uncharacterized protein LOC113372746 n=1 Tax=Ctenocephalides felis TaxID=7515 RepID=UPI000E6E3E2E|nr:uncharacterized protein LOC113372746 [Ctenocephalides felis]
MQLSRADRASFSVLECSCSIRTADTNSDSLHSLSSDSETCSCPATSNVNLKSAGRGYRHHVSTLNTGGSKSLCSITDSPSDTKRNPETISRSHFSKRQPETKRPALELLKSPGDSKNTKISNDDKSAGVTRNAASAGGKKYLDFGSSKSESGPVFEPGCGSVKSYVRSLNRSCENLTRVNDLTTVRGNLDTVRELRRTNTKSVDQQTVLQQTIQYLRPTLEAEMQTLSSSGKENFKIHRSDKVNHLSIASSLQNSPKKQNFLTDFNSSSTTKSVSEPCSKVSSPERGRSAASADEDCDSSSDIDKQILSGSPVHPQQGIIQVYAAYDTGLATGASLRLRVTNRTSAAEVVELVVRQLHVASVLRGGRGLLNGKTNIPNTSRGLSLPGDKFPATSKTHQPPSELTTTTTTYPTRPTFFTSELKTNRPSGSKFGASAAGDGKNLNLSALSGGVKEKAKEFCLVAVIGARERRLRDDFRPLQLQDPWMKGRLYVRHRKDTLAAIEHSTRHKDVV